MSDFLAMGGHAAFVWPSFGVAALVLGGLWWSGRRRLLRAEQRLAALKGDRA